MGGLGGVGTSPVSAAEWKTIQPRVGFYPHRKLFCGFRAKVTCIAKMLTDGRLSVDPNQESHPRLTIGRVPLRQGFRTLHDEFETKWKPKQHRAEHVTPIFQGLEVQRGVGVACRASSDRHTALRPVPAACRLQPNQDAATSRLCGRTRRCDEHLDSTRGTFCRRFWPRR
jgi:hypothetical protein